MVQDIQPGLVRRNCLLCDATFWAARSDAKFCKDAHRNLYFRWKRRLPTTVAHTHRHLQQIADYMDYHDCRDSALENLLLLRSEINRMLREKGVMIKEIR